MTKNRTRTPVYLDPGMHPGLEVKGLININHSFYRHPMPGLKFITKKLMYSVCIYDLCPWCQCSSFPKFQRNKNVSSPLTRNSGGGPRVVVSAAAVRVSVPGLGGLKETKMFLPHPRVKVSIVGSLRDREVACSALDRQGSNFESCVWRTVSSHSSHHPQEVLLTQFSLYVHKGGLKPDSFHS